MGGGGIAEKKESGSKESEMRNFGTDEEESERLRKARQQSKQLLETAQ